MSFVDSDLVKTPSDINLMECDSDMITSRNVTLSVIIIIMYCCRMWLAYLAEYQDGRTLRNVLIVLGYEPVLIWRLLTHLIRACVSMYFRRYFINQVISMAQAPPTRRSNQQENRQVNQLRAMSRNNNIIPFSESVSEVYTTANNSEAGDEDHPVVIEMNEVNIPLD